MASNRPQAHGPAHPSRWQLERDHDTNRDHHDMIHTETNMQLVHGRAHSNVVALETMPGVIPDGGGRKWTGTSSAPSAFTNPLKRGQDRSHLDGISGAPAKGCHVARAGRDDTTRSRLRHGGAAVPQFRRSPADKSSGGRWNRTAPTSGRHRPQQPVSIWVEKRITRTPATVGPRNSSSPRDPASRPASTEKTGQRAHRAIGLKETGRRLGSGKVGEHFTPKISHMCEHAGSVGKA